MSTFSSPDNKFVNKGMKGMNFSNKFGPWKEFRQEEDSVVVGKLKKELEICRMFDFKEKEFHSHRSLQTSVIS